MAAKVASLLENHANNDKVFIGKFGVWGSHYKVYGISEEEAFAINKKKEIRMVSKTVRSLRVNKVVKNVGTPLKLVHVNSPLPDIDAIQKQAQADRDKEYEADCERQKKEKAEREAAEIAKYTGSQWGLYMARGIQQLDPLLSTVDLARKLDVLSQAAVAEGFDIPTGRVNGPVPENAKANIPATSQGASAAN